MTFKRWDGATQVDVATLSRWSGSSWVAATICKRWDGSTWVDITLPGGVSANVTPTADHGTVNGYVINNRLATSVTTNAVTVTAVGGTGPYTYAWTRLSGSTAVDADSPTNATTTFTAIVPRDGVCTATFRCTVTDSLGSTGTVNVVATLTHDRSESGL